mmetsp:Transcript_26625/g.68222  ORF Transcript_26625/g.68222 Transcript_26625/m.68222 type:complete len:509 (+) Transcript_26625:32-1558(+)
MHGTSLAMSVEMSGYQCKKPGTGSSTWPALIAHYLASVLRFIALAVASRALLRAASRFVPILPDLGRGLGLGGVAAEATDASSDLIFAALLHVFASCLSLATDGVNNGKNGNGLQVESYGVQALKIARPVPSPREEQPSGPPCDTNGNDEDDADRQSARSCGFACGGQRRSSDVEEFAPRLQKLIWECRRVRDEGARFRIFDDCTVKQMSPGGVRMELTEIRCSHFRRLRECSGVSQDEYYESVCAKPFSGGTVEVSGKSGSIFLRSHDNHLVLKTIEEHEFEVLRQILPHMLLYLEHHRNSLLCRFLGAYALTIGNTTLRFVVMANCLPRKADQIYDLKGTTEDRYVDPASGGVLKDLNFSPYTMQFGPEMCTDIVQALCDDADFLESVGTMDYSLLVGVTAKGIAPTDEWHLSTVRRGWLVSEKGQKVEVDFQLGVIDFLQRWTPKKVAAHWLKKATIGCFHEIDTEPPAVYCQRFSKFLFKKILAIDGASARLHEGPLLPARSRA